MNHSRGENVSAVAHRLNDYFSSFITSDGRETVTDPVCYAGILASVADFLVDFAEKNNLQLPDLPYPEPQ